jgi:hypothetical protein
LISDEPGNFRSGFGDVGDRGESHNNQSGASCPADLPVNCKHGQILSCFQGIIWVAHGVTSTTALQLLPTTEGVLQLKLLALGVADIGGRVADPAENGSPNWSLAPDDGTEYVQAAVVEAFSSINPWA